MGGSWFCTGWSTSYASLVREFVEQQGYVSPSPPPLLGSAVAYAISNPDRLDMRLSGRCTFLRSVRLLGESLPRDGFAMWAELTLPARPIRFSGGKKSVSRVGV